MYILQNMRIAQNNPVMIHVPSNLNLSPVASMGLSLSGEERCMVLTITLLKVHWFITPITRYMYC